jgi:hypothetical protein
MSDAKTPEEVIAEACGLIPPFDFPVEQIMKGLDAAGYVIVDSQMLKDAADRLERMAFSMPIPNAYTPQFVQFSMGLRAMTAKEKPAKR